MVEQDWPEELLQHELGEELSVWGRGADGKMKNKTLAKGEVKRHAESLPASLPLLNVEHFFRSLFTPC